VGEQLFKPGQRVTVKGDDRLFFVPDADYWKRERKDWLKIPYYAKLTEDEFVAEKMRTATNRCIECFSSADPDRTSCREYLLVELDALGCETGEIDTHICEKTIRLAK